MKLFTEIGITSMIIGMNQNKPWLSVIIPVLDATAYLLASTLDSIFAQEYRAYQVVIIDGTKRGLYRDDLKKLGPCSEEKIEIYSAAKPHIFVMMNQGVLQAKGEYLHFLSPGEFYISRHVFSFVEKFVATHRELDMAYSGSFVRHQFGQPTVLFKQITLKDLQGGRISNSLQAYWFCRETLQLIGLLSEKLEIQGGFEIVCRIHSAKTLHKAFMPRILTDYEYRKPSSKWVVRHFSETLVVILFHFGLSLDLFSMIGHHHLKLVRWWWKMLKTAFWKQNVVY